MYLKSKDAIRAIDLLGHNIRRTHPDKDNILDALKEKIKSSKCYNFNPKDFFYGFNNVQLQEILLDVQEHIYNKKVDSKNIERISIVSSIFSFEQLYIHPDDVSTFSFVKKCIINSNNNTENENSQKMNIFKEFIDKNKSEQLFKETKVYLNKYFGANL